MIYVEWYGGSSYSWGDDDDIETFSSVEKAKEALKARRDEGYYWNQHFEYIRRAPQDTLTPCVDWDSVMWCYKSNPLDRSERYPDFIIEFGPRGGVRVSPA